jgi:tetratricopeptide (TPR) repeat protein
MESSTRSVRVRWAAVAAVLLTSVAAAPAWGAKDPKEAEAHAQYEQGLKDYDLGRFKEALDEFSKAYELKALPGFLFNIAQCHRQLHSWERAAFFYRRFLDLSPKRPSNEKMVKELITECDDQRAQEAEAERKKAEEADEARRIELAKAEARKTETEAAARREEEERRAAAAAAAALVPMTAPGQPTLVEPPPPPPPIYKRWWFWTGVGVIAAGAVATTAYFQLTPSPTSLGTIPGR